MSLRSWSTQRTARKALKNLREAFRLNEDVLTPEVHLRLSELLTDLTQAIRCKETEDLPALIKSTQATFEELLPKQRFAAAAEWFDVLVAALSVAFCFRAYYYQPFRIPTGSMQPTLYGIHTETASMFGDQPGSRNSDAGPTIFDRQPLRFFKWAVTGSTYEEVRIRRSGYVLGWAPSAKPGYRTMLIGMQNAWMDRYDLPDDAADTVMKRMQEVINATQKPLAVRQNQVIWSGTVLSGDFLFVNRWIWNFRHPRLGETIVFSTRTLPGLPPDQHYIKRLCGRPGDKAELKPGDYRLWLNGKPALKPSRLEEISRQISPYPGAPAYPGFQAAPSGGGYTTTASFSLKPGEYLALGDNAANSLDSRYWGTVPARNLLGPATFVHWPFASPRWGTIR